MKIDELPDLVLTKIIRYLPTYKKVSLVSRKFYDTVLLVNNKNYLSLNHEFLTEENRPRLESIKRTNKKVSNVKICFRGLTQIEIPTIISIIEQFSAHIKYLKLIGLGASSIKKEEFLRILSLVPNVELLIIGCLVLKPTKLQPLTLNNEELNLKHLRILHIFNSCIESQVVFNRLPAGVLTELEMYVVELRHMYDLFNRQTNINKLVLYKCLDDTQGQFFTHIVDNLKLESLECSKMGVGTYLTSAVSRQTKLKCLKLGFAYNDRVDKHLMKKLTYRLPELETLEWKFGETSADDFFNVGKFKNLKHLTLNFRYRSDIIDLFTEMDNSRIVTLEMKNFGGMSSEKIQKLAISAPQLKDLKFLEPLSWKQAIAVLKHFNFVEFLTLSCTEEPDYDDYTNQNISANPNLIDLGICFNSKHKSRIIKKIIADYPNLRALDIGLSMALHPIMAFRLILGGFRKLESLSLSFEKQLNIDDLQYLRDHTRKLQYLSLGNLDKYFVAEHMDEFKETFEVVRFQSHTLAMAVDVKTMNRKMYCN